MQQPALAVVATRIADPDGGTRESLAAAAVARGGSAWGDLFLFDAERTARSFAAAALSEHGERVAVGLAVGPVERFAAPVGSPDVDGDTVVQALERCRRRWGTLEDGEPAPTASAPVPWGREDLVAAAAGASLVTVSGPTGMGSSRVAACIAGVPPLALGGVRDAQGVVGVVGAHTGVPLVAGRPLADATARVGAALAGDDVDTLLLEVPPRLVDAVAALVGAWREAAPSVRWVVDAPRPLGLPGERVVPVGPLRDPLPVWRGLGGEGDPPCGSPLALRLLAPRGAAGDWEAAAAVAWDRLSEGDRDVLAACVPFRGGIAADAGRAVVGESFEDRVGALGAWLDPAGPDRVALRPALARWVAARRPAPEAALAHATWFAAAAEAWSEAMYGRGDELALARIRTEAANLVAVLDLAPTHPELAARAALPLRWIPALAPSLLGHLDAAVASAGRVDDRVLRARVHLARGITLRTVGRWVAAEADLEQALSLAVLVDHKTLAGDAMRERAMIHLDAGRDPDEAGEGLERAVVLHRSVGNAGREALCWSALAVFHTARGHVERADQCLAMARTLAGQAGMVVHRPAIWMRQGLVDADAGRDARARFVDAHDGFVRIHDRAAAGHCALLLSRLEALSKRVAVAAWWLARARAALGPIGDEGTTAALEVGASFVTLGRALRALEVGALDAAQRDVAAVGADLARLGGTEVDGMPLVERSPLFRAALRQLETAWWDTPDVVIVD